MKWDHSLIDTLEWGNQISHKEDKIKIADLIASKVENGQVFQSTHPHGVRHAGEAKSTTVYFVVSILVK